MGSCAIPAENTHPWLAPHEWRTSTHFTGFPGFSRSKLRSQVQPVQEPPSPPRLTSRIDPLSRTPARNGDSSTGPSWQRACGRAAVPRSPRLLGALMPVLSAWAILGAPALPSANRGYLLACRGPGAANDPSLYYNNARRQKCSLDQGGSEPLTSILVSRIGYNVTLCRCDLQSLPSEPAMPPQYSFTFTYDDLVELTGLSKNMIYQYRVREDLNPESLESLMMFFAGMPAST